MCEHAGGSSSELATSRCIPASSTGLVFLRELVDKAVGWQSCSLLNT